MLIKFDRTVGQAGSALGMAKRRPLKAMGYATAQFGKNRAIPITSSSKLLEVKPTKVAA
jgi:hypothetical protein